jgi:hypothetical protein
MELSTEAEALFRLHVERMGKIDIDDCNRKPYRELEAAGLVLLGRPFTGEPRYHLTRTGYDRKREILATSRSPAESAWRLR